MTQIAVVIPVLGRPQQIQSVVASIESGTTVPHRILFVCSPNDPTIEVCRATGYDVLTTSWEPDRGDFAKKINLAYESTDEEWLFQAATDISFHANWDVHALNMAASGGYGVVGTNDLGNPSVKRGQHSTHTLFSRAYIEEFGGTVDNTGSVLCELYDHQWCDNEFVQTAKYRRKWVFSQFSVVEHHHPTWRKGEMDATYEKALRESAADYELFRSRMPVINPNSPEARRARRLAVRQERLLARQRR